MYLTHSLQAANQTSIFHNHPVIFKCNTPPEFTSYKLESEPDPQVGASLSAPGPILKPQHRSPPGHQTQNKSTRCSRSDPRTILRKENQ